MSDNPYSAPLETASPQPINQPKNIVDFGEIIRRWERRRIFYNVALLCATLLVAGVYGVFRAPIVLLETAVFGAVGANVLFFYGPVSDGYLQWIGVRHPVFGKTIFLLGTTLALLLAVITVASLGGGF